MNRATRKAIVYALVLSCGEEDLSLLQELSGIPRSTFYKLLAEIKSESGFETAFETIPTSVHRDSMKFLRRVLRLPITEQLYLRQETPITTPITGDLGDLQTCLTLGPNPGKETERDMSPIRSRRIPVREWNPTSDHGKLVVYFAIGVYRVRGKDATWPKGDVRIAYRNARSILNRGYILDEGRGVVDYYLRLGRDIRVSDRMAEWVDGYPWSKFVSNFDEYFDRGVRTDEIVIRVPDIDQAIFDWTAAADRATGPADMPLWDLSADELAWYKQNRTRKNGKAQTLRLTHYRHRLDVVEMLKADDQDFRIEACARTTLKAGRSLKVVLS